MWRPRQLLLGHMYSIGKVSITFPLTFHVDLPWVGCSQPFTVVSLTAEQCCFIKTCRGKNKGLFTGPAQNAQIAPILHLLLTKNPCGFLSCTVALFFSSNTKDLLFSTHRFPSWHFCADCLGATPAIQLTHLPRREHEHAVSAIRTVHFYGTVAQPPE